MRYIYIIVNLNNGKAYVGQSYDPIKRLGGHFNGARRGSDHPFYRAIRKHGEDRFEMFILESCLDMKITDEREKFWINGLRVRSRDHGYNLVEGGRGVSDLHRKKLSEALKGNKHCVGREFSKESRKKSSRTKLRQADERLGKMQVESVTKTCACGNAFTIEVIKNRCYGYDRSYCSPACANFREHSQETKKKIAASLRHPQEWEMKERIAQGIRLIDLMKEFDVSYSKLKRLKRELRAS